MTKKTSKQQQKSRPHMILFADPAWQQLKVTAAENGLTVSSIIRRLAELYVRSRRRQRRTP